MRKWNDTSLNTYGRKAYSKSNLLETPISGYWPLLGEWREVGGIGVGETCGRHSVIGSLSYTGCGYMLICVLSYSSLELILLYISFMYRTLQNTHIYSYTHVSKLKNKEKSHVELFLEKELHWGRG